MMMKMNEKEQDIDEGKRKNIDLSNELLDMKKNIILKKKILKIWIKKQKNKVTKMLLKH